MINYKAVAKLNLTPGQLATLVMYADIYTKNPAAVQKLLNSHGENFTGNPNVDLLQILALGQERGDFFKRDWDSILTGAKYFSLSDAWDKLQQTGQNIIDSTLPVAGSTLQALAPIAQGAAGGLAASQGLPPSTASGVGQGFTNIGTLFGGNFGIPKTPTAPPAAVTTQTTTPPPTQNVSGAPLTTSAPAVGPMSLLPDNIQNLLGNIFGSNANNSGGLDNNPDAGVLSQIIQKLGKPKEDTTPKTVKIFGKEIKVWVLVVSCLVFVALVVIVVILIRRMKKKKKEGS